MARIWGSINGEKPQDLVQLGRKKTPSMVCAFLYRKKWSVPLSSVYPFLAKLIYIHIVARSHNIIIVQVYAPTSSHKGDKVENLHGHLKRIKKIVQKDILAILREWNAKVDSDTNSQQDQKAN